MLCATDRERPRKPILVLFAVKETLKLLADDSNVCRATSILTTSPLFHSVRGKVTLVMATLSRGATLTMAVPVILALFESVTIVEIEYVPSMVKIVVKLKPVPPCTGAP